jgi:hypothetical protein
MNRSHQIPQYNYTHFIPSDIVPFMAFDESPAIGSPAPDFPVWQLDGTPTKLSNIWTENLYTIIEFGSFT